MCCYPKLIKYKSTLRNNSLQKQISRIWIQSRLVPNDFCNFLDMLILYIISRQSKLFHKKDTLLLAQTSKRRLDFLGEMLALTPRQLGFGVSGISGVGYVVGFQHNQHPS